MSFEVEIKIFLSDEERKTIENYFETSSQFTGKYSQIDHYFDTTEPSFAKLDKALRVRFQNRNDQEKIERKIELTFKGPKLHSDSKQERK